MNDNFIPITFIGGTGGAFLSGFLTDAKNNNLEDMILSKHGNAHGCNNDVPIPTYDLFTVPDMFKIKSVLACKIPESVKKPCFVPLHILDLNLCLTYFNKSIRITYEEDDISELAIIFIIKNLIDIHNHNPKFFKLNNREKTLKDNMNFFKPCIDTRVLNVSWKELYKGDVTVLTDKLSKFTGITTNKFNIKNLIAWRLLTEKSHNDMFNQLNNIEAGDIK